VESPSTAGIREGIERDAAGIPGLTIVRDWMSHSRQAALLREIEARPWSDDRGRAVQHAGWRESPAQAVLDEGNHLGPIPEYLSDVVAALRRQTGDANIGEATVTALHVPGNASAIGRNDDHFARAIASLQIESPAVVMFTMTNDDDWPRSVDLNPGDLLIVDGEARTNWNHTWLTQIERGVTMTFRSVRDRELVARVNGTERELERTLDTRAANTPRSIFDTSAQAVLIPVNTAGVITVGIARMAADLDAGFASAYRAACETRALDIGKPYIMQREGGAAQHLVAFPIKRHWRNDAATPDIALGLTALRRMLLTQGITSIAIPPLATGIPQRQAEDIASAIASAFDDSGIDIDVRYPHGPRSAAAVGIGFKGADFATDRVTTQEELEDVVAESLRRQNGLAASPSNAGRVGNPSFRAFVGGADAAQDVRDVSGTNMLAEYEAPGRDLDREYPGLRDLISGPLAGATFVLPRTMSVDDAVRAVSSRGEELVAHARFIANPSLLFTVADERPLAPNGRYHKNWFSNFEPFETPLVDRDGLRYPTPEHAYHLAKLASVADRAALLHLSPGAVKREHRGKPLVKDALEPARLTAVMARILRHKFAPGTRAAEQLVATGTREIVEWNNWGDRTWGRDIATGVGKNQLGVLLMEMRKELRPHDIVLGAPERARERVAAPGAEPAHERKPMYAGVGSRSLGRSRPLARIATALAMRLERAGYGLASGGADGADRAFEKGVALAENKQIFRPGYDATKKLPDGYVVLDGPIVGQAAAVAGLVTSGWDVMSGPGRDLHTRNVFQVLGRDMKSPVEFVLAIPSVNDTRTTGTRQTMAIAAANGIPVFDLTTREGLNAAFARVEQIERAAGLTSPTWQMVPRAGSLRIELPVPPPRHPEQPIIILVKDVRDIEPEERGRPTSIYAGRTRTVPGAEGLVAYHELGNPFVVGVHGMRGACAELHAELRERQLADPERSSGLRNAYLALAELAAAEGELTFFCHCGAGKCHCDAEATIVAEALRGAGHYVRTNVPDQKIDELLPIEGAEALAFQAVQERTGTAARRFVGPWTHTAGTVLAIDDRAAYIERADQTVHRLERSRLPGALEPGVHVTLRQSTAGFILADHHHANALAR
jgi:predicted NAD-dependent protein-ADP-ribosyltransferase YbiA (DUF1768 family)/alkylated DNA repair dioxygenase AlkB